MRYVLRFLSYCVDITKCLPNAYHNRNPNPKQEPMSRSMQLHYILVTAFSWTDLFLDQKPWNETPVGLRAIQSKNLRLQATYRWSEFQLFIL